MMAAVPGIHLSTARPGEADLLASLHDRGADGGDPAALLGRPPTRARLEEAIRGDADVIIARARGGAAVGYGLSHSWTEQSGTVVHLLDPWSLPGPDRPAIEEALLVGLTDVVVDHRGDVDQHVVPHSVLGTNGDPADLEHAELLDRLGFRYVFEMVELELRSRPQPRALPDGVTTREARLEDAAEITDLTNRVWAGRPYFTPLSYASGRRWLARADLGLFLLAEQDAEIIGIVATKIDDRVVEIDDVQTAPQWQRRGVASALLTQALGRIRNRTGLPIRLVTEGHDPAGARSLYESLGFVTVSRHGRYRKPLPTADPD